MSVSKHLKDHFTFFLKGKLTHDENACDYCGLCAARCPHKSLKVDVQNKQWKIRSLCMRCERCIRECPKQALSLKK